MIEEEELYTLSTINGGINLHAVEPLYSGHHTSGKEVLSSNPEDRHAVAITEELQWNHWTCPIQSSSCCVSSTKTKVNLLMGVAIIQSREVASKAEVSEVRF